MTARPTRGAGTELAGQSWAARPAVARVLRLVIVLAPAVASLVATWLISPMLYRPDGWVGVAVFIAQLGAIGFTVAVLTERLTRRFVPLANLLAMSMVFPDRAPSRFGVALRSGTVRQLEREVEHFREHGLSDEAAEAAEQLLVLVNALGKHERLTRGHTERVRAYSELIGQEMDLTPDEQEKLRWGSLIHDVGKLAVPAPILSKESRLEDEEWRTIKLHPEVGAALVQPLESWLGEWRLAASEHHERWDGAGYPLGLAGTEISLAGRIVAVADTYDIITSTRSYKQAMSADDARQELVRCAGSQFDPDVVRAFLAVAVGRLHPVAGRFAWLANIGSAFQAAPAAIQAAAVGTAGAVGVTAAVAAGAVEVPREVTERDQVATAQPAADPGAPLAFASPSTTAGAVGSPPTTFAVVQAAGIDFPSIPVEVTSTSTSPPHATTTSVAGATTTVPSAQTSSSTSTTSTTTSTTSTTTSTTSTVPAADDCSRAQSGDPDLSGADLVGCDLAGVDLADADLTGADLTGAILDGATFRDADMDDADLTGVSAIGTNLSGADLDEAILAGANLENAVLEWAKLQQVDLRGAVLRNALLFRAELVDADATGAVFDFADVHRAKLDKTVLVDASMFSAWGHPLDHPKAVWGNTTCPDGSVRNSDCFAH